MMKFLPIVLVATTLMVAAPSVGVLARTVDGPRIDNSSERTAERRPGHPGTQVVKKAMTWVIKNQKTIGNKTYVLFGSDYSTNAYTGDTLNSERRSLLCVDKANLPQPHELPISAVTPGGATIDSWSGARAIVIPNVQGNSLTSLNDANLKCKAVGQIVHGSSNYRMAEFHDGDPNTWAGWSFWAEAYSPLEGLSNDASTRFWVHINDQNANPW
jgi:hypothetical protein